MKQLIIPIGPAGCGKSSFYNNNFYLMDVCRISADDIRFKLLDYKKTGVDFDQSREYIVWGSVWEAFISHINKENSIYLDATNLTQKIREPFRQIAKQKGYDIKIIYFKTNLYNCLTQNMLRDRHVNEKVIARQFLALEPPEVWEGAITEVF